MLDIYDLSLLYYLLSFLYFSTHFLTFSFTFHFSAILSVCVAVFFFFQAEDGIRDIGVTGVQTCALPIWTSTSPTARTGSTSCSRRSRPGRARSTSWWPRSTRRCRAACGRRRHSRPAPRWPSWSRKAASWPTATGCGRRSEEHTSELQSRQYLVCRLLLE